MGAKKCKCRRGQTLILFILALLAFVGILALTLDFGFVLLSRRVMQTAVNTGALEGARDIGGRGREDAREVIRNVFDDDLDPTENTTTLGAGPDHSLVQRDANDRPRLGAGTNVRQLWNNRHRYIYRPAPELNADNQSHGDLVAGTYQDAADSHGEAYDYQRDDFDASQNGQAFLARIRRTTERNGIANPLDRIDGVSSSGSGSPLLMGHLMPFVPRPSGTHDIRRDGVTIRATAIADSRPIVYVGSATTESLYCAIPYGRYTDSDTIYDLDAQVHRLGEPVSVGEPAETQVNVPTGYMAILHEHEAETYVVGFLRRVRPGDDIRRKPNASPRLHDAIQSLNELTPEVRDAVLTRHRELAQADDSILARVPILVRSIR